MRDEHLAQNAALHALDLLSGDELLAFERELARNPALRFCVNFQRDTIAQLAHAPDAPAPSPELRQRILTRRKAP